MYRYGRSARALWFSPLGNPFSVTDYVTPRRSCKIVGVQRSGHTEASCVVCNKKGTYWAHRCKKVERPKFRRIKI